MASTIANGKESTDKRKHLFQKGNRVNPSGRPKGVPNKYSQIKKDLLEVWSQSNAKQVMLDSIVRKKRDMYGKLLLDENGKPILEVDKDMIRIIVSILPKETKVSVDAVHDVFLTDIVKKSKDYDNNRIEFVNN